MTNDDIYTSMAEVLARLGFKVEEVEIDRLCNDSIMGCMIGYILGANTDTDVEEVKQAFEDASDIEDEDLIAIIQGKMKGYANA